MAKIGKGGEARHDDVLGLFVAESKGLRILSVDRWNIDRYIRRNVLYSCERLGLGVACRWPYIVAAPDDDVHIYDGVKGDTWMLTIVHDGFESFVYPDCARCSFARKDLIYMDECPLRRCEEDDECDAECEYYMEEWNG